MAKDFQAQLEASCVRNALRNLLRLGPSKARRRTKAPGKPRVTGQRGRLIAQDEVTHEVPLTYGSSRPKGALMVKRWDPWVWAAGTGLIGLAAIVGLSLFVSSLISDHDTKILLSVGIGLVGGYPTGHVIAEVFIWRREREWPW